MQYHRFLLRRRGSPEVLGGFVLAVKVGFIHGNRATVEALNELKELRKFIKQYPSIPMTD